MAVAMGLAAWAGLAAGSGPRVGPEVTGLRFGTHPSHLRVVLDLSGPAEWSVQEDGRGGVAVLIPQGRLGAGIDGVEIRRGILRKVEAEPLATGVVIRLHVSGPTPEIRTLALADPHRIVVDLYPAKASATIPKAEATAARPSPPPPPRTARETPPAPRQAAARPPSPAEAAPPLADPARGARPLTIVLDPGHGGYDTGAVGPSGLMEKDVVLDLALRLRRLLETRLGVRVLMTRTEDVFVPLAERTAMANRAKADFFISLHVNGAEKRGAGGFETFFFSREPSDNDARASAQRENLVLESNGATGKDQESLLKITLADMAVTRDMKESSTLAEILLAALDAILRVDNRGVKSGPFYVLATAAMPAVLVESAFITNPREERRLQRQEYRQRLAEAIYEAIAQYKVRYEQRVGMPLLPPSGVGS